MKISSTKKAFVIMMVALVLHSSSASVGQKLQEKGGTGGTTDPSLASPTEIEEDEGNLRAPTASILNQRLPFSKPLKGQTDKTPSELQQQQAAQGLSYQDHQPAVGSGLAQPLSGPNQPFSPGAQNSLVQNIPFANGALKQTTSSSIQQAALLVSVAAVTVFLLSLPLGSQTWHFYISL